MARKTPADNPKRKRRSSGKKPAKKKGGAGSPRKAKRKRGRTVAAVLKRLDELLNIDPADEDALIKLYPVEDDLQAFRHWLGGFRLAAAVLVGSVDADRPPPMITEQEADQWGLGAALQTLKDSDARLAELAPDTYAPNGLVAELQGELRAVIGREQIYRASREAPPGYMHMVALTWLDQVEEWAESHVTGEHRWIADCHSGLVAMLKQNIAVIEGNTRIPHFEARRCLWCDGLFVAEAGGKGRPREYCRPSHRVRASEAR